MQRMIQFVILGAFSLNCAAQSLPDYGSIDLMNYVGYYELGEHHPVIISFRTGPGGRPLLVFTDLKTDAVRALFPAGAGRFSIGPDLVRPDPAVAELRFKRSKSDADMELEIAPVAAASEVGERLAIRTDDVQFEHAGITFGATLFTPLGAGPAPGVLLVAGSEGDADRYSLDALAWVLASRGFVVLAYDKRGTGTSGGTWRVSLEVRAADGAAALDELRRHGRVDANRVGVIGFSEGGWLAPMIARLHNDVAFLVAISGGGRTKADTFLTKYRKRFLESGMTDGELEKAMAEPRSIVDSSKRRLEAGEGTDFDLRMLYDPKADWQQYGGAVLAIMGEVDALQDSRACADWLRATLAESKSVDWEVKVFPMAHHPMFRGTTGQPSEFAQMRGISHFVPGYWATLLLWLDERYGN